MLNGSTSPLKQGDAHNADEQGDTGTKFGKRATLVAAGPAQAEPTVVAACDNAAFTPYLTAGPNGWLVNGDVRRAGDQCGTDG